jgi:hypothetical protein
MIRAHAAWANQAEDEFVVGPGRVKGGGDGHCTSENRSVLDELAAVGRFHRDCMAGGYQEPPAGKE